MKKLLTLTAVIAFSMTSAAFAGTNSLEENSNSLFKNSILEVQGSYNNFCDTIEVTTKNCFENIVQVKPEIITQCTTKVDCITTETKPIHTTEATTVVKPEETTEATTVVKPDVTTEATTVVKPEETTEATTVVKPEETTEATTVVKPDVTTEATTVVKPDVTTEATTVIKPDATTEMTTVVKPDVTTEAKPTTEVTTEKVTVTETTTETTTEKTTVTETSSETTTVNNNQNQSKAEKLLELVNQARKENGLSSLTLNNSLSNVAQEKAKDMRVNNYFSHTSPTYGSPFDMIKKFGISYKTAGENIAKGQKTPEAVFNAWMNSSGHRANILNSSYTQMGIGEDSTYWCQMFIG